MCRLLTIIISLSTLTATSCLAQNTHHYISFGLGAHFGAIYSDLISPNTHTGGDVPLQTMYWAEHSNWTAYFQLAYRKTDYKSPASLFATNERWVGFQSGIFRGPLKKGRLMFAAGALLDGQASFRNNTLNAKETGNNSTGEVVISLCPALSLSSLVLKGRAGIQLSTSLGSYMLSSGYALSYPEVNSWMWPGQYTCTQLWVDYYRQVAPHLGVRLDYQFTFRWLSRYESVGWLHHQAIASLVYTFNKVR